MKKFSLVLLVIIVVIMGCVSKPPCLIKIIDIYQEDVKANDGVVQKRWKTVIELPNKSRGIVNGKYGIVGDSFWGIIRQSTSSEYYIELVEIEEDR